MSNPFEEMFGKPKRSKLHLHTTTVTHWEALQFNKKLNEHLESISESEREGAYNRSVQIQYHPFPLSAGMQYTALVVEEWMTDLPDDEDEDDEPEGKQTEGPMIHPVNMMFNARKMD